MGDISGEGRPPGICAFHECIGAEVSVCQFPYTGIKGRQEYGPDPSTHFYATGWSKIEPGNFTLYLTLAGVLSASNNYILSVL